MDKVDETLEIRTRPGIETNERIVFERRGHQYPSAIPADVIFTVQDRPHPFLKRVGADLEYTTSIGKTEALYGFTRYIPTLEKGDHTLEVKELVRLDTVKVIPEKGLPLSDNPEKRGNIIVKFRIVKDKIHGYKGGKN